jgi:hypothetical protein
VLSPARCRLQGLEQLHRAWLLYKPRPSKVVSGLYESKFGRPSAAVRPLTRSPRPHAAYLEATYSTRRKREGPFGPKAPHMMKHLSLQLHLACGTHVAHSVATWGLFAFGSCDSACGSDTRVINS